MNKNLNVDELEQLMAEKPIDWRELIEKYIVFWKWIVFAVILALLVGLVYYRAQYDKYQFKSTLLITDNASGQTSQMSILKQLDAFGMSTSSSNIYNEKQVIHSREMIKKVVYELKLYNHYSIRSFLKPIELYSASPIEVIMDDADMLRIGKPLEFSVDYDVSFCERNIDQISIFGDFSR